MAFVIIFVFFGQNFGLETGMFTEEDYNPFSPTMAVQYNQMMFNLTNVNVNYFDILVNCC